MKISELKQPYRRMAEYLAEININPRRTDKTVLIRAFDWNLTDDLFWDEVESGNLPEITHEIKTHFPPNFDFSGEEVEPECITQKSIMLSLEELFNLILETHTELSKMGATGMVSTGRVILNNIDKVANLNKENQRKIEDENLQKRIYTQLAKEGKFDELPDTCEFSEPVELEVWDLHEQEDDASLNRILGKFKGKYISDYEEFWNYAQAPTKKIDFSLYNPGDILEITNKDNEKYYGLLHFQNINELIISFGYKSDKVKSILKDDILSISKLK